MILNSIYTFTLWLLIQTGDPQLVPYLSSLGVGGVIGGLALTYYRIDRKDAEKRYEEKQKESAQTITWLAEIVSKNTGALTSLEGELKALRITLEENKCPYIPKSHSGTNTEIMRPRS